MDFASFYDEQHDYAEFRNDPEKRREYTIIVDWKVNNLVKLLPAGYKPRNVLEVGCAFGILAEYNRRQSDYKKQDRS
jgi:hypothetical protein